MQSPFLSSLLCLLLLVPQSICTCAVASFACSDQSCVQTPGLALQSQREAAVEDDDSTCSYKPGCCHDDEDAASSRLSDRAIANPSTGSKVPDPSHEHKRHQPDCPTNQVNSDWTSPKPQVEIGNLASIQLLAKLPVTYAAETKTLVCNPLVFINPSGPPLFVTHRALLI